MKKIGTIEVHKLYTDWLSGNPTQNKWIVTKTEKGFVATAVEFNNEPCLCCFGNLFGTLDSCKIWLKGMGSEWEKENELLQK